MTLGCALTFAINVTHYVSMTVEITCFLFHSLIFLLSDSRHPVKQALFHALSCLLSVRVKDLKSPEIKISYFIFHIFGYIVTLLPTQPNFSSLRETDFAAAII